MSIGEIDKFECVSNLMEKFNQYDEIFKLVSFRYNGKNEDLTLHYRLRTYNNFMSEITFIENLLEQYLKNPIQIPSDLFYIEIYDQQSSDNLGLEPKYFGLIDNFFFIKLSNLINLESDYIDIFINSKFKLDVNRFVVFNISKQPRITKDFSEIYELTAFLKSSLMPERFQFINITLDFRIIVDDVISIFIQRKDIVAARKWYNMEVFGKVGNLRKKNLYNNLIRKKYKITPLQFREYIQMIYKDIYIYLKENHRDILKIENFKGKIMLKPPEGIKLLEQSDLTTLIRIPFETRFDNKKYVSNALLTLNFNWMKDIVLKYFKF